MNNNAIDVVDQNVLHKLSIYPRYITFRCERCGNIWGVNVEGRENIENENRYED